MVNGYLAYLADYYHHPQIDSFFFREWTRVGMTLTKSDEYTENWLQRTYPGVIQTATLIIVIVMVAFAANALKLYSYKNE